MPKIRGISRARAKRLSSERCTSPEDEHASSLKYIEAAYSGDIKPLRDLTQNFQVKLDSLIQYVERLKQAVSDRVNYFHAGLILQSSREVYSRKVDYLEMLLDALVRTASSVELVLEKPEADVEQKKCNKRHKQLWPKLEEFKRVSKEEITILPESQRVVNFDLPKTVRLPPILPMLLMPPICNHVFLRDTKGDVMGRKADFRVNWPINRQGMPIDLAKQLQKTSKAGDEADDHAVFLANPKIADVESDADLDDAPMLDDSNLSEPDCAVGNGFAENLFAHDMCSTPAPHPDHAYEMPPSPGPSRPDTSVSMTLINTPFTPMLDPNTRPKRSARKLPAAMTLSEFITGKRKPDSSASKRKRKAKKSSKDPKINKSKRAKLDFEAEAPLLENCTIHGDGTAHGENVEESQPLAPSEDVLNSPRPSSATPSHAPDWDLGPPDDTDDEVADIMSETKESEFSKGVTELSPVDDSTPTRQQEEADDRYQTWTEKIRPILQRLDEKPKFDLRDTARTIIQDMKVGEKVSMGEILRHRKPEQVSRNFVALLQLCNTRNVEIGNDSVLLLSDGFKLAAEIPLDDCPDQPLSPAATESQNLRPS
ncbi:uncharacterized protein LOC100908130 [Galendromus occidentalis]|uniref:Uncharacterized protein LOC100908130 n=1 Tax=Galendromus occidentalis TaxID=34638 RepID=A0AAJ6VXR1_9ACAR|nr:uncharacterized protein LOC100908130 [Galendromus occidentalis]